MRSHLTAFLAGVQFLTRIPVPSSLSWDEGALGRATTYFPLIGAIVGLVAGATYMASRLVWPPGIAATLAVLVAVLMTGAFHEDALADAADALGGSADRERALEIMRDSRIGSYGGVALVLLFALRITTLAAFAPHAAFQALVVAHSLGRWSSLPLIRWLPHARSDGAGAARPFVAAVTWARLAGATGFAIAISWLTIGAVTLAVFGAAAVITLCAGRYFARRIGGITGDCLGATNVVVEVGTYLVVLAWWRGM